VGDEGTIFRTTSASFATWDTVPVPGGDTSRVTSVDYAGSNTFYAVNRESFYQVMVSSDDGMTFAKDSTFPPTFYYPEIDELDFANPNWGVMTGTSNLTFGIICMKRYGFWEFIQKDAPLHAVFVVDSTLAFVGGDNGKIYRYKQLLGVGDPLPDEVPISIYPNPVTPGGMIQVSMPVTPEDARLSLFSVQGTMLDDRTVNPGTASWSYVLPYVAPGVYLLRMQVGDKISTTRLVVQP
jgi:hypothetical protein